jgi:hypothetical protein
MEIATLFLGMSMQTIFSSLIYRYQIVEAKTFNLKIRPFHDVCNHKLVLDQINTTYLTTTDLRRTRRLDFFLSAVPMISLNISQIAKTHLNEACIPLLSRYNCIYIASISSFQGCLDLGFGFTRTVKYSAKYNYQ